MIDDNSAGVALQMDETHRTQLACIKGSQLGALLLTLFAGVLWAQRYWESSARPMPRGADLSARSDVNGNTLPVATLHSEDAQSIHVSSSRVDAESLSETDGDRSIDLAKDFEHDANRQHQEAAASPPVLRPPSSPSEAATRWFNALSQARSQFGDTASRSPSSNHTLDGSNPSKDNSAEHVSSESPANVRSIVTISNATDHPVAFVWNDSVERLKPHTQVKLPLGSSDTGMLHFDRGGEFGKTAQRCSAGEYEFRVGEQGWQLHLLPPVAPAPIE